MMKYGPYNVYEIATILGVSHGTVSKWIRKYKDFPSSNTGLKERHVLYADSIYKWMKNQEDGGIWGKYLFKLELFFNKPQIDSIEGDLLTVKEKEEY